MKRCKGYRDRSALPFAILFFLHISLPECHRQHTRIKCYGLCEKAGHGNPLFGVHSCLLNTDWPCLPLPFSSCLFLEQLLHFSWLNSSPFYHSLVSLGTFESHPMLTLLHLQSTPCLSLFMCPHISFHPI